LTPAGVLKDTEPLVEFQAPPAPAICQELLLDNHQTPQVDIACNIQGVEEPVVHGVEVVEEPAHQVAPLPAKLNVQFVKSISPFTFMCNIHPVGVIVNTLGAVPAAQEE